MMCKILIISIVFFNLLGIPVCALDGVDEYVTEDMDKLLPPDVIGEEGIDYNKLWDELLDGVGEVAPGVIKNIGELFSVIILASVINLMCTSLKTKQIGPALCYLSSGCIAVSVYHVLSVIWESMSSLLEQINAFMITLTPVTTLLYSMGGNITTAALNNTAMGIILTVFETVCYHGIRPVLRICFGFGIVTVLSGDIDLSAIAKFVRKTYTTVLVFVMSSLICVLSLQNMLSVPKDSLGIRTVKFAAANSIPLVGGAIGEAAATVGAGIGDIRGSLGVLAIIAIAIMVLPVLLSMWMNKIALSFVAALCSVFGLKKEESIISSSAELINFALAITVSSAAMFIIDISIFATVRPVIGG